MPLKNLSNADRCALVRAFDASNVDSFRISEILECSEALVKRLRRIYKQCDPHILQEWFISDRPVSVIAIECTFLPGTYNETEV